MLWFKIEIASDSTTINPPADNTVFNVNLDMSKDTQNA
tara:strand:+ start:1590 stop:1703 length:114 start_codon:yes stop_codon:yes gene_type:complete